MNRFLEVTTGVLVAMIFALAVISSARAQQQAPLTPEQQQYQDAIGVVQREAEAERNRARQAELALTKMQRDLAEAQKAAAACKPEKKGENAK